MIFKLLFPENIHIPAAQSMQINHDIFSQLFPLSSTGSEDDWGNNQITCWLQTNFYGYLCEVHIYFTVAGKRWEKLM